MALRFGPGKDEDLDALISRKNYARAIEIIKERLKGGRPEARLRLQLADVLILAGRGREAVAILEPLADEFAKEGFAAKAVAVLKKIQKADPDRRDVEAKLAGLIEEKQRFATLALPASQPLPEIGMEEIDVDPGSAGPVAAIDAPGEGPAEVVEIGFEVEPDAPIPPAPMTVVDRDLVIDDGMVELPPLEVEPDEGPAMTEGAFVDELLTVVDQAFQAFPSDGALFSQDINTPDGPAGPTQIVVSPLFKDFAVDEMVAVIHGLSLRSFERGQVVLRQGDAGDSLFILAAGSVRVFIKDPSGRQVPVGDLSDGAFFGEVSILTGRTRTATVVALSRCDLLELDRATLDRITQAHPHVRDVLQEFCEKRLGGKR